MTVLSMFSDFRHALRGLIARPAFTLIAVLTLALGIGANTAMFSALFHTIIQPLPFDNADRFAQVWQSTENGGLLVSPPDEFVAAWKQRTLRSIEQIEQFSVGEFTLQGGSEPEVLKGVRIGPGVMRMLE